MTSVHPIQMLLDDGLTNNKRKQPDSMSGLMVGVVERKQRKPLTKRQLHKKLMKKQKRSSSSSGEIVPFGHNVPIPKSLDHLDEFKRCLVCYKSKDDSDKLLLPISFCQHPTNSHLAHAECAETLLQTHCPGCNGFAPLPYHELAKCSKSLIADQRRELQNERDLGSKIRYDCLQKNREIEYWRIQQEITEKKETCLKKQEVDLRWRETDFGIRLRELRKQENELRKQENDFQQTVRAAADAINTVDVEVDYARALQQKYEEHIAAASEEKNNYNRELKRLKKGSPQLGAPPVRRIYGTGCCVFCGYSKISTLACGVCTQKYIEGSGEVEKVRADGIIKAIHGAGYVDIKLKDIEALDVNLQQLLYSKVVLPEAKKNTSSSTVSCFACRVAQQKQRQKENTQ